MDFPVFVLCDLLDRRDYVLIVPNQQENVDRDLAR